MLKSFSRWPLGRAREAELQVTCVQWESGRGGGEGGGVERVIVAQAKRARSGYVARRA